LRPRRALSSAEATAEITPHQKDDKMPKALFHFCPHSPVHFCSHHDTMPPRRGVTESARAILPAERGGVVPDQPQQVGKRVRRWAVATRLGLADPLRFGTNRAPPAPPPDSRLEPERRS